MDRDKILEVAEKMIRIGGSFHAAIGRAMMVADGENLKKLMAAFPEAIERYKKF